MSLVSKAFSDIVTFSRSSNATRIGPTGLVEYAPHNLLQRSQEFDNAAWSIGNASITANSVSAPDGTITADKLVENSSNAFHYVGRTNLSVSAITYTASFYAKAAERTKCFVDFNDGATGAVAYFDLSSGTSNNVSGLLTVSITSVGNGWYRIVATRSYASATSGAQFTISPTNADGVATYTGDGTSGIYLWGAQLSVGPYPLDYTPTTSAAVYGPRFDYDPVTLAARGLLIEEQRSNVLTYSEDFSNAAWSLAGTTITANSIAAPDGTNTADTFTAGSGGYSSVFRTETVVSGNVYTVSIYAKANTTSLLSIEFRGSGSSPDAVFNLSTGTVSSGTGAIVSAGNGWYRCSITKTSIDTSEIVIFGFSGSSTNAGDSIYIWGAQLESGSFATSYIPTVAASVTRSADVASVNTLSPWFNATEMTVLLEASVLSLADPDYIWPFSFSSSSVNAFGMFKDPNTGNFFAISRNATSGSLEYILSSFAITPNTTFKAALAGKTGSNAFSVNGQAALTSSSASMTNFNTITQLLIGIGDERWNGHIRRIAVYPRRLTNAELQALTA